MKHFHYIFTGTGLAALMTIYEMIQSNQFNDKSILLIDEVKKEKNDKTWCFWDNKNIFDSIVSKKWNAIQFKSDKVERVMKLNSYEYKMIRSKDFYKKILDVIAKNENITITQSKVTDFRELGNHCIVKTDLENYTCNKVINSIFNPTLIHEQTKYPLIQQHFIGWYIKTESEYFNDAEATFMDFSINQKNNTRFMYVLPISKKECLIEYTLFSKDLLEKEEYEIEIEKYIKKLGVDKYEIIEKEYGNIPMTCYPFWKNNTKNIINIGSAGGWTKASTGYTFKNATKKSKELVQILVNKSDFNTLNYWNRFWFYDLILLDILFEKNHLGSAIFSSIFKKNKPETIFRFLDEESSFMGDLKIIIQCPKIIFIESLFKRILK